jgi:hypothetical protein
MKVNAEIICITGESVRCQWRGGYVAAMQASILHSPSMPEFAFRGGTSFSYGGLRLRVVGMACGQNYHEDRYYVMQEGLFARFRAWKNRVLGPYTTVYDRAVRIDESICQMLGRPLKEGGFLPRYGFAVWCYKLAQL